MVPVLTFDKLWFRFRFRLRNFKKKKIENAIQEFHLRALEGGVRGTLAYFIIG